MEQFFHGNKYQENSFFRVFHWKCSPVLFSFHPKRNSTFTKHMHDILNDHVEFKTKVKKSINKSNETFVVIENSNNTFKANSGNCVKIYEEFCEGVVENEVHAKSQKKIRMKERIFDVEAFKLFLTILLLETNWRTNITLLREIPDGFVQALNLTGISIKTVFTNLNDQQWNIDQEKQAKILENIVCMARFQRCLSDISNDMDSNNANGMQTKRTSSQMTLNDDASTRSQFDKLLSNEEASMFVFPPDECKVYFEKQIDFNSNEIHDLQGMEKQRSLRLTVCKFDCYAISACLFTLAYEVVQTCNPSLFLNGSPKPATNHRRHVNVVHDTIDELLFLSYNQMRLGLHNINGTYFDINDKQSVLQHKRIIALRQILTADKNAEFEVQMDSQEKQELKLHIIGILMFFRNIRKLLIVEMSQNKSLKLGFFQKFEGPFTLSQLFDRADLTKPSTLVSFARSYCATTNIKASNSKSVKHQIFDAQLEEKKLSKYIFLHFPNIKKLHWFSIWTSLNLHRQKFFPNDMKRNFFEIFSDPNMANVTIMIQLQLFDKIVQFYNPYLTTHRHLMSLSKAPMLNYPMYVYNYFFGDREGLLVSMKALLRLSGNIFEVNDTRYTNLPVINDPTVNGFQLFYLILYRIVLFFGEILDKRDSNVTDQTLPSFIEDEKFYNVCLKNFVTKCLDYLFTSTHFQMTRVVKRTKDSHVIESVAMGFDNSKPHLFNGIKSFCFTKGNHFMHKEVFIRLFRHFQTYETLQKEYELLWIYLQHCMKVHEQKQKQTKPAAKNFAMNESSEYDISFAQSIQLLENVIPSDIFALPNYYLIYLFITQEKMLLSHSFAYDLFTNIKTANKRNGDTNGRDTKYVFIEKRHCDSSLMLKAFAIAKDNKLFSEEARNTTTTPIDSVSSSKDDKKKEDEFRARLSLSILFEYLEQKSFGYTSNKVTETTATTNIPSKTSDGFAKPAKLLKQMNNDEQKFQKDESDIHFDYMNHMKNDSFPFYTRWFPIDYYSFTMNRNSKPQYSLPLYFDEITNLPVYSHNILPIWNIDAKRTLLKHNTTHHVKKPKTENQFTVFTSNKKQKIVNQLAQNTNQLMVNITNTRIIQPSLDADSASKSEKKRIREEDVMPKEALEHENGQFQTNVHTFQYDENEDEDEDEDEQSLLSSESIINNLEFDQRSSSDASERIIGSNSFNPTRPMSGSHQKFILFLLLFPCFNKIVLM